MNQQALFEGVRFLMKAEETALRAGIECRLKTLIVPAHSPCGMKLVFNRNDRERLSELWTRAGLKFKIEDENSEDER